MPKPTPRQATSGPLVQKRASTTPALPVLAEQKGVGAVKVYNWGDNNLLAQELIRLAYDSGTAEACLRILAQFIGGEGFADPATAEAMANPEQTFNELLAEAKHYTALGIGVTFALRFDLNGESPDIYVVEAECVRRERDGSGRFVLNDRITTGKMPIASNRVYLPYHKRATPAQLAEEVLAAANSDGGYWGHLWWSFEARVGRKLYPWPSWYAGREDVESDAALPRYDRKQLKNGFMPDAIITLVGEKFRDILDPDWEPREGEDEEDRPLIKSPARLQAETAVRALKGESSESSVMLNTVEEEGEKPQIDWVDKGPNSKGLTDMRSRIEGAVYRRFGVPPVLDGVSQPGLLGNNQQIMNSLHLFGLVVRPARALITSPLAWLRPDLDFTVKALNVVEYIDPAILAKMTPNEVRKLGDLVEVPGGDTVPGVTPLAEPTPVPAK